MKKFTLYILTAFGLMGLATSCNDFGDVNNDPYEPESRSGGL